MRPEKSVALSPLPKDAERATLSIVVITSGRSRMLEDCLRSLGDQTVPPHQVIVVDDGSGVSIPENLTRCPTQVLRLPSSVGPCGARNAGTLEANGSHILFLDDDDLLTRTAVERYLEAINCLAPANRERVAFLSGIGFFADPTSQAAVTDSVRVAKVNLAPSLPLGAHYSLERIPADRSFKVHNTLVISRSTFNQVGGWDVQLPASEHTDLFFRVNEVCSLTGIDEVLYLMRRHSDSRLSMSAERNAIGRRRTYEKHEQLFLQNRRSAADYLSLTALRYHQAGRLRAASWFLGSSQCRV